MRVIPPNTALPKDTKNVGRVFCLEVLTPESWTIP
jgi:hypothetical protein